MQTISESDIKYNARSNIDEIGRVFSWQGNIYRGIYPSKAERVRAEFECGMVDELIDAGLIPDTHITDYQMEKYPLILSHRRIELDSFARERITYNMIRDEGLLVLELMRRINKYGYTLKDCHRDNILHEKQRPIYVDLGSIVPVNKFSFPYGEFISSYVLPLMLLGFNAQRAYYFIRAKGISSVDDLMAAYQGISSDSTRIPWLRLHYMPRGESEPESVLDRLADSLPQKISDQTSTWSGYQDTKELTKVLHGESKYTSKQGRYYKISELIKQLSPESVLEFGANKGAFALMMMRRNEREKLQIQRYIASDYDVNAVDDMYTFMKSHRSEYTFIDRIYPVVLDFNAIVCSYWDQGFEERMRSDLVLAMALTHHLILSQGMPMDFVFRRFAESTNKWLVVEFMPKGLWGGNESIYVVPEWYTIDTFKSSMEKFFTVEKILPLETNRIVLVGRKRSVMLYD